MRIIPVIDVMTINGKKQVVHGKKGDRSKYQPITSVLTKSTDPVEVALVFQEMGFKELYVADLDAIVTGSLDLEYLTEILKKTTLAIMVDAGIRDEEQLLQLRGTELPKIIVALETLRDLDQLNEYISLIDSSRMILSIDLFNGQIKTENPNLRTLTPFKIVEEYKEKIGEFIILDLARVGSDAGVAIHHVEGVRDLIEKYEIKIITGGGVRTIEDLMQIQQYGVAGILIATALHNGRISKEKLLEINESFG